VAEYRSALRLSPQFAPAAINLADLYRQLGREPEGAAILRTTIAALPRDAGLHYALGLALIRLKRPDEAIGEFQRAAEIEPNRARYSYVYGVALNSAGRREQAITVLKENLLRHPRDRDTLLALISFAREAGDLRAALDYAQRLAAIIPGDPNLAALIEELQRKVKPNAQ
jgi:Flp pilus assembly protein TadD